MKMKIEDILNLKTNDDWSDYVDLEVFSENYPEFVDYGMYGSLPEEFKKRLKQEEKMHDYCNDSRSRTLVILYFDEIPFYLYQYVGKGDYKNLKILDVNKFTEFLVECIKYKLSQVETIQTNLEDEIEIQTYGADRCYIEDNKLITRYF